MKKNYPLIVPETFTPHWDITITNDEYHADKSAVGSTGIKEILKSANAFYSSHVLNQRSEGGDALRFGSACHMALLEPELFAKSYVIMPAFSGLGSMKMRADWKESLPKTAVVLKAEEYEDLMGMINSVSRHTEASNLLKKGVAEQAGYFRDPTTGIKCRVKPDFFHPDLMALIDVKTTRSCQMSDFSRAIATYRYDFQIAMYCLGIEQITGKKVNFPLYLVIEKEPPYEVALYLADEIILQKGRTDYTLAMEKLKRCLETDQWEPYQTKHQPISLPKWALGETL